MAIDNTKSLTPEQKGMIEKMKFDMMAENSLSESCQYVWKDKPDEAMAVLERIEWQKTSVKISPEGIGASENKEIISFFESHKPLSKDSCERYASMLFNDSLQ